MVRITIRIKWNGTQEKILDIINKINYFNSIQKSPKKVLNKINALNLKDQIMNNGSYCDDVCEIIIIFLNGSGRVMEMIIECFGKRENDINYAIKQRDKIIGFLDEKKIKKVKLLKKNKIIKKIDFEELKVNFSEFERVHINSIPAFSVFITTIGLLGNFLYHFFIFSPYTVVSLIVFLLTLILDFGIWLYYNKLGGRNFAYIPS
ncbi:hypothetical protein LCGC14_0803690 [marine sediment metagenome]|uniref:Uncharacterized protein n=1 Tax=marine sediment metagenome TaxID=412755 RepID=A0A0F9Q8P3_9ZZZZ|nr:MAG: hypothetical protein Lokiarch_17500 [Candidatus Lokiarchaeum sp. GC14_75]